MPRLGGGGYSETEKSQSAKICLNFNFRGGGGNSETEKSQSAKICLIFNFFWGGGYSETEKSQSAKICLNFNFFWGGRGILNFRIGVFCRIWTKFSTTPAGSCITDSLSHTTYVETNK